MVLAGHTFEHIHHGDQIACVRSPVQHGVGQDIAVNHRFPSVFDCPCKTGRRFGVGPFATSFRSGRHSSSLATRRVDLSSSSSLVRSTRLSHHVCDHFPKRAHRAGAVTPFRQEILKRQAHLGSNRFRAPLHRVVLSKFRSSDAPIGIDGKEQGRCLIPTKRLPK